MHLLVEIKKNTESQLKKWEKVEKTPKTNRGFGVTLIETPYLRRHPFRGFGVTLPKLRISGFRRTFLFGLSEFRSYVSESPKDRENSVDQSDFRSYVTETPTANQNIFKKI